MSIYLTTINYIAYDTRHIIKKESIDKKKDYFYIPY